MKLDNNNNKTICTECWSVCAYNSEKGTCDYCSSPDTAGFGCEKCIYNLNNKKYECLECDKNYYAFITNKNQCLHNIDMTQLYLYGCQLAYFNEETKNYECIECKYNYN